MNIDSHLGIALILMITIFLLVILAYRMLR